MFSLSFKVLPLNRGVTYLQQDLELSLPPLLQMVPVHPDGLVVIRPLVLPEQLLDLVLREPLQRLWIASLVFARLQRARRVDGDLRLHVRVKVQQRRHLFASFRLRTESGKSMVTWLIVAVKLYL